ncbi:MAG: NADH-quinone oxidoreductase subunit J [Pirellulaceae bacterium]|nr:NADH-quinone oxidoreductase subunit J [Pirellulaceae bacterium]
MLDAIETILTVIFSCLTLLTGVGFVIFRQPVYAALSFTATVLMATVLYILQEAAYLAAATMVIYACATIIIFLFVLMFAQHSNLQSYELKYSNLGPAVVASTALVMLLTYAIMTRENTQSGIAFLPMPPQPLATSGQPSAGDTAQPTETAANAEPAPLPGPDMSVAALGRVTYTRYLWTIELAGTLLLVAACGAIMIAQRETSGSKSTGVSS